MSEFAMAHTSRYEKPHFEHKDFDDKHKNHHQGHGDHGGPARVISDPSAVVDGRTITEWSQKWLKTMFRTPGDDPNTEAREPTGFRDPTGEIARSINDDDRMFFITGAPTGAERTFHIDHGQDVLLSIRGAADTEGPGIEPTLPGFTDAQALQHVKAALGFQQISDVTLKLDGKDVPDLKEVFTIFDAGISREGSAAHLNFNASPGASLATTGQKGYFAVFKNLSDGEHTIETSSIATISPSLTGAPDPLIVPQTNITHIIVG